MNSDSDPDSGHCEASELSSDIESVMVPLQRPLFTRHISLIRSKSAAYNISATNDISCNVKADLCRTVSNLETQLTFPPPTGGKHLPGSPRLAHMKMTSYRRADGTISPCDCLSNASYLARKSDLSKGYRYFNGDLIDVSDDIFAKPGTSTGRKYLFQGLLHERASLWDNMDFWEYLFMDVVAAEREALGMNQGLGEVIER